LQVKAGGSESAQVTAKKRTGHSDTVKDHNATAEEFLEVQKAQHTIPTTRSRRLLRRKKRVHNQGTNPRPSPEGDN